MNQISKRRKEIGLTQKEVAEKMESNIRWVQKLENNEINIENITFMNAVKLIKVLYEDSEEWSDMRATYILLKSLLKK